VNDGENPWVKDPENPQEGEFLMMRTEICVCGHSQSSHRTYGCTGTKPNPDDPKKHAHVLCQCKKFQAQKIARERRASAASGR
jgi:hypothetical protein